MAFLRIVFLKRDIEKYLTDHESPLDPPSRQVLELAHKHVESSQEIAKRVFGSSERRLVDEIRGAAYELETALDSFIDEQNAKRLFRSNTPFVAAVYRLKYALIPKQIQSSRGEEIENLEKQIYFFSETIKKLVEEEYADELYKSFPQEDDDEEIVWHKSKMVGLSDQYNGLKQRLTVEWETALSVVSLDGMPGIGKTTLAREVFDDPDVVEHFDCRVWVTLGRNCCSKEVPRRILAEVNPQPKMRVEKDEDIALCLNESLKGKRYLIVLDDVWDKYMGECLKTPIYSSRRNEMKYHFPDEKNGSRLFLISRMQQASVYNTIINMRLMNEEESWDLLREKVFGEDQSCPSQLERFGRKIAEKCEGLPLTIVTVANLLSKVDQTAQCWNEIVTRKNHQLFKAAYDEIMKVLLPSFEYLPQCLQMCFMFLGVFPQDYEIPRSKLFNLWSADGFLEPYLDKFTYLGAIEFLEELASNNMVMICENTIIASWGLNSKAIKTCRLHSSLWHLSHREGRRSKFSYVLNSRDDGLEEGIEGQRRLSFHINTLFGIKEVCESVEDNCASTAHSLLCYGPYLQYQVPVSFGLRLLRELDALTIRFYEFPVEVLQLVELRYLALTLNGKLPPAISQLSKVRFLIVDRHLSIKSRKETPYLPMEMWDMKELEHLQVTGYDLLSPRGGAFLGSLSTLSRATPKSCTDDVLRAIPNLNKLGIQVELEPDNDGTEPFGCLGDHVSHLWGLLSLKCVVVNPKAIPAFSPLSNFPPSLRKLSLSGLSCAWEEMSAIASLKHLKVLKLRNYAFQGTEWEVRKGEFPSLEYLVIEDTDLVKWKCGNGSLFWLEWLIIKRCYKLKEISGEFGGYRLSRIEMFDCNPLGTKQMKETANVEVRVNCSWYDKKAKA